MANWHIFPSKRITSIIGHIKNPVLSDMGFGCPVNSRVLFAFFPKFSIINMALFAFYFDKTHFLMLKNSEPKKSI